LGRFHSGSGTFLFFLTDVDAEDFRS
jgi:hypothetical protein